MWEDFVPLQLHFVDNVNNVETHFLNVPYGIGFYLLASSMRNILIVTTLFNHVLAEDTWNNNFHLAILKNPHGSLINLDVHITVRVSLYILSSKFKQTVVVLVLKLVECVQPVRRDLGAAGGAVPGALSPGLSAIRVDGVGRVQRQVRTRPTEPHQRGWLSSVIRRKSRCHRSDLAEEAILSLVRVLHRVRLGLFKSV